LGVRGRMNCKKYFIYLRLFYVFLNQIVRY